MCALNFTHACRPRRRSMPTLKCHHKLPLCTSLALCSCCYIKISRYLMIEAALWAADITVRCCSSMGSSWYNVYIQYPTVLLGYCWDAWWYLERYSNGISEVPSHISELFQRYFGLYLKVITLLVMVGSFFICTVCVLYALSLEYC